MKYDKNGFFPAFYISYKKGGKKIKNAGTGKKNSEVWMNERLDLYV